VICDPKESEGETDSCKTGELACTAAAEGRGGKAAGSTGAGSSLSAKTAVYGSACALAARKLLWALCAWLLTPMEPADDDEGACGFWTVKEGDDRWYWYGPAWLSGRKGTAEICSGDVDAPGCKAASAPAKAIVGPPRDVALLAFHWPLRALLPP
jgi:hypothetical protein